MRARIWLGGAALIAVAIMSWLSNTGAAPAPAAPAQAEDKPPSDDRDEFANKLMGRVTIEKSLDQVPLKEALEFLSSKYGISLIVDPTSFKVAEGVAALELVAVMLDEDGILKRPVNLPAMKNVRLATVLKYICDQIDGVYLLYPDHIKLVSGAKAHALIGPIINYNRSLLDPTLADEATESPERLICSIPLVHANYVSRPLQEALHDVEVRTNRSIAVASQAGEKGKIPVTVRLTNVPVETAVATLAEMAGLKMVRKGNVLLVTTSERAKDFDPPPPARPFFGGGGGGLGGAFMVPNAAPPNEQIEELKKKVAELEKTIAELKSKK